MLGLHRKAVIVCTDQIDQQLWKKHARLRYFIGVEQGISFLIAKNIKPFAVSGDFDSISSEVLIQCKDLSKRTKIWQKPENSDLSDLEFSLQQLQKHRFSQFTAIVTGNRWDHLIFAILLVNKYNLVLINNFNKVFLLERGWNLIKAGEYNYFSLYPLTQAQIIIQNAKYNLPLTPVDQTSTYLLSNEYNKQQQLVKIWTNEPIIIIKSKK